MAGLFFVPVPALPTLTAHVFPPALGSTTSAKSPLPVMMMLSLVVPSSVIVSATSLALKLT